MKPNICGYDQELVVAGLAVALVLGLGSAVGSGLAVWDQPELIQAVVYVFRNHYRLTKL